jgi:ATP-dependent Lhr-like helicase
MNAAWRARLPRVYDVFFGAFGQLRPVQVQTIPLVLERRNVLVLAPTGSGKTEAAVAPLAELALDSPDTTYALYLAPTRALINDLQVRLEERLALCGLRLAVRHSDRNTFPELRFPAFVLTTPESLEVMLCSKSDQIRERLREVRAVVIDEAHQYFGTPRGLHLYCLLERLKHFIGRPLQRICLSATVGDPDAVADFFRGSDAPLEAVRVDGGRRLRLYLDYLQSATPDGLVDAAKSWLSDILGQYRKVLLFANTRVECDWLGWKLGECLSGVPVLVHYSNLHRDYRESVERRFREQPRAVCIATSTLELGIDIGDVDAVAMWGAPHTVTSFLQRLGRGNRRTETSVVYAACPAFYPSGRRLDPDSDVLLFVALAACAVRGVLECRHVPTFYSVILQQLLALCCQWEVVAPDGFSRTIARPPAEVTPEQLVWILDHLTRRGVLEYDQRRGLWRPNGLFHRWRARRSFWTNIPPQPDKLVLRETKGETLPLAELPRHFLNRLRPGDVVVVAGKPRLVLGTEAHTVRVTDLVTSEAELAKYHTPPEPVPVRVAGAIADVLTLPDDALGSFPIAYDPQSKQVLRTWRERLGARLRAGEVVVDAGDGQWVIYTFAGTVVNLLLSEWLRARGTRVLGQDTWRVICADRLSLRALATCDEHLLARVVGSDWRRYEQYLPHSGWFDELPERLKRAEVLSMLDLQTSAEILRGFAQRAPSGD